VCSSLLIAPVLEETAGGVFDSTLPRQDQKTTSHRRVKIASPNGKLLLFSGREVSPFHSG
jgi:hypothetical protein